jgi:hypothetical protein
MGLVGSTARWGFHVIIRFFAIKFAKPNLLVCARHFGMDFNN